METVKQSRIFFSLLQTLKSQVILLPHAFLPFCALLYFMSNKGLSVFRLSGYS